MRFKCLLFFLPLVVVFNSCDETVSTDLPEYELNLSVTDNYGQVQIRFASLGDINFLDVDLYHNDSLLNKRIANFNEYTFINLYPDEEYMSRQHNLRVEYNGASVDFDYRYSDFSRPVLSTTYADTIIDGVPIRTEEGPVTLEWNTNNDPDFHVLRLSYIYHDFENHQSIFVDTSIVTNNQYAEIPPKFNQRRQIYYSIEACWGANINETDYSTSDPIAINFRKCSVTQGSI